MTAARLVSLLQLAGPGLPTGAFACSDGLERLSRTGRLASPEDLHALVEAHHALSISAGDAWFARRAHRHTARRRLAALGACAREEWASSPAALQRRASAATGRSLLRAALAVSTEAEAGTLEEVRAAVGDATPRATMFGSVAAIWQVAEEDAVAAHAFSALSTLVDAAVRLGVVAQLRGQRMLREILASGPPPAGGDAPSYCSPLLDIAVMSHETDDARHFAT
jgi:urease accessory protein